ncbi:hypothetical protein B0A48_06492 [Cryoendolithus antarcticus]|uniref:amidase n=1 Tax=Cryoendolithus antarcticus TaxID=1507870 RepID=A0A1V8TBQ6_9PEZI|nr:hypothetical protein B0A48_06492 [Cryoendolithus antarcticus]
MSLTAQGLSWQDVAATAQKHRDDTIAKVKPAVSNPPGELPWNVTGIPSQLLPKDVLHITESPPESLLSQLSTGALTSTAVTTAFLQRAGLASKLVNCITELLPARALARAKALDDYYATRKKPVGPLHGLPISVKEHISMKDLDLNAGFISWVGQKGTSDALILRLLWSAGAVFYARTTEPQTLMHLETSSNIFGVTVNPYNTTLTSGGSSGGEGALVGLRGSCLGIGTDIGGSIRSPAANQGVFGLRPSSYRLPLDGFAATMIGEEHVVPVVGPLSTSLEGIKVFMKVLIDQKPWLHDPMLVPLPWKATGDLLRRDAGGKRKLRIGVLRDDGMVRPHPPILRGIDSVVSKLSSHPDIEIIDFPPYDHDRAWRIISSLYFADGAAEEKEAIDASGEPWRPLSKFIIKENPNMKSLSVTEVWRLTGERDAYRAAYTKHWNSIGTSLPGPEQKGELDVAAPLAKEDDMVDVILCPVGPGCAPPLNCARYWNYTSQWNLLDYPAVVFPTGLYCGAEDKVDKTYKPMNEKDEYNHELCEYHIVVYVVYDYLGRDRTDGNPTDKPETYTDAPISLQLVGRRYEDEKLIEALEMIMAAAKL